MMTLFRSIFLAFCATCLGLGVASKVVAEDESVLVGLKWRNIGPAFMSGRIADIAWHPDDLSVWYVAVGSGGVWKTSNAGVTWTPIFDEQSRYSIGNVTATHILSRTNPDHVRIGRIDRHVTDGVATLFIEDRLPGDAGITGFPYAT